MALQVLFLVLCLFLGQVSEVRAEFSGAQSPVVLPPAAQPPGPPPPGGSPDSPAPQTGVNSSTGFNSWTATLENTITPILSATGGPYSLSLLFTRESGSNCSVVVQHVSGVAIWVANFDVDVKAPTAKSMCNLSFTAGGLVLRGDSDVTDLKDIWTSKNLTSLAFGNMSLEASGELSFFNSSNAKVWSSFDSPTDTLVNTQDVSFDSKFPLRAAGLNSKYSSGGIFYLRRNGSAVTLSQNILLNGISESIPYYSTPFEGVNVSSIIMENSNLYVEGTLLNESGSTVKLNFSNSEGSQENSTAWNFAKLESNGALVLGTFDHPEQNETYPLTNPYPCSLPAVCGDFGLCSGNGLCACPTGFMQVVNSTVFTCELTVALGQNAGNCTGDRLVNYTGWTYVNVENLSPPESDIFPEDCERKCSPDCSCRSALHVIRNVASSQSGACFINPSPMLTILNESDPGGLQRLFLRIPPEVTAAPPGGSTGSSPTSSRRTAASAFAGGAGALLLVLLGVSFCWLFYSRRKLFDEADKGKFDSANMSQSQLPPQYSYEELQRYTSNFDRRLGYGGGSSCFEGRLPDNRKIAVKVLDDNGHMKEKEFLAAMATVGGLSHPNLVPLWGFCSEGRHRMLVYELVNEGRSLNYFLFRLDSGPLMDAQARRSIALETACGLAHLHDDRVIHGGVKPENIMIDRDMRPRLVDYGLVNLMTRFKKKTGHANERFSRAYMAPEWERSPPVTEKVDVYSFGVVLLELVSGRRCLVLSGVPEERRFLPTWGFSVLSRGPDKLFELADPRLDIRALSESDQQVLQGMTFIALRCVQEDPSKRPPMASVVRMLDGDIPVNAPPPPSRGLYDHAARLCAGYGRGGHSHSHSPGSNSLEGSRFMDSPSVSENSEMLPSPFHSSSLESENSRHDHAWLLETQQSL